MRILFITAHKYLPQMHGGMQSSTDQLCRGLIGKGHQVSVLAGLMPGGWFGFKNRIRMQLNEKLGGRKIVRENNLGYPVWYSWFPWEAVDYVAGHEKPDVIVVTAYMQARMALAAKSTGIPFLVQFQDVEFSQHGGALEELGPLPCIANSRFTAEQYRLFYGLAPVVIYPFITPSRYRTYSTKKNVTFINPHPKKGRDLALEIARRCPDIPFSFVESWPLAPLEHNELLKKIADLPNVTFHSACEDMREVYGKCRILLAPSLWNEGYGRVVTEAQLSGIPALASNRGGLPEAVGPGGVLLDPEAPPEEWVAALHLLWEDDKYYAIMSACALMHAQRPEIDPVYQLETWEQSLCAVAKMSVERPVSEIASPGQQTMEAAGAFLAASLESGPLALPPAAAPNAQDGTLGH